MTDFSLHGLYRVQSRRDYAVSALAGRWYADAAVLDNDAINRALRAHPLWQGQAQVALRPALVSRRSGKFAAEPDILYKPELFVAAPGSAAMGEHIVDVLKSRRFWRQRVRHLRALFGAEQARRLLRPLRELRPVIANEYVVHEAGHLLGYDVARKRRDGYFAPGGRTAWPLVYLEELRADLNGFGFAAGLLPPARAAQVLLYNLLLRFGVHRQGQLASGAEPYGLVPYLLFCVLSELGGLAVRRQDGRLCFCLGDLDSAALVELMHGCARHAQRLNEAELAGASALERAFAAADYLRSRLGCGERRRQFAAVMGQAAAAGERP